MIFFIACFSFFLEYGSLAGFTLVFGFIFQVLRIFKGFPFFIFATADFTRYSPREHENPKNIIGRRYTQKKQDSCYLFF